MLVSSVSDGGHGGDDRLIESVSLNFREVKYEYKTQTEKGGKGSRTGHLGCCRKQRIGETLPEATVCAPLSCKRAA